MLHCHITLCYVGGLLDAEPEVFRRQEDGVGQGGVLRQGAPLFYVAVLCYVIPY